MSDFKFHVVLFQPEIPQNTGAIGRLCVNLDIDLHLIKPLGFSLDASRVRRAGLDYWPHLKLKVHENWHAFLATERPQHLYFASTRGRKSIFDFRYRPDAWFVFGRETSGFPESFYELYADRLYKLPMPGPHSRSLNLACSVSVICYEAYRQFIQL